jgi:hypothetical protein
MDWTRIYVWTRTLYTLIHSIHLSKQIHFGNLTKLNDSILDARNWVNPICSFNSVLMPFPFGNRTVKFRRDPNRHFEEIAAQIIKMLVQDLVVIFDEMMFESITARGQQPGNFPQSKVEYLRKFLDPQYAWAANGCLELIAVRNSLCHANGVWNAKSIAIVKPFVRPAPANGDKVIIGFPALFHYRKAIRTFLNETKV